VQQQNPDGFPTHSRHQLPFNRLLRHQSHGPTCLALGWPAAYHGDDVLLLMGIQHLCRAVTLFLIPLTAQAGPMVAMAEPPDCLRVNCTTLAIWGAPACSASCKSANARRTTGPVALHP
jgi:hypothetical protein